MAAAKLSFEFSGAFGQSELSNPVFLRHKGVHGGLRLLNGLGIGVDKVKIILKGKTNSGLLSSEETWLISVLRYSCEFHCSWMFGSV